MGKKLIEVTLKYTLQYLTLIVLLPPISLCYLGLRLVILISRLKLYIGKGHTAHVSQFYGGRMYELDCLSNEEQLDFKRHRSSTYTGPMMYGSLWEFSKYVSNQQRIPLIKDRDIHNFVLHSVFCHGLIEGETNSNVLWRLPFQQLDNYRTFEGFYWDVKEIRLLNDFNISIVDRAGTIHTKKSKTWSLAKAHAQAQLSFFAPGLAHNHVHFVFPTLMASYARTVLSKSSVLRQLIEPHTRFTQYINFQALNKCQSSSNTDSFVDRWFKPWLSFPIQNEDFLNGIKTECERFYYESFFLKQNLRDDLPYHKFLNSYYSVVQKFIKQLQPLLEKDYAALSSSIEAYLPSIKHYSMVDVITTLVWNCGIVHFSDHQSYIDKFARKYGCMSVRKPLVNPDESSLEVSKNSSTVDENEEFCNHFAAEDVYRTRCFINCFVQFNASPKLDMSLRETEYNFKNSAAKSAVRKFMRDLDILDKSLRDRNADIVPLKDMVRTVCF